MRRARVKQDGDFCWAIRLLTKAELGGWMLPWGRPNGPKLGLWRAMIFPQRGQSAWRALDDNHWEKFACAPFGKINKFRVNSSSYACSITRLLYDLAFLSSA